MSKIEPDVSAIDRTELRDEIAGLWSVNDLIRELYSLSGKFIDYKRGLV